MSDPEIRARAIAHGHSVAINVAMDYRSSGRNHDGEAIFCAKHLYAIPVDGDIISMAALVNDEPRRYVCLKFPSLSSQRISGVAKFCHPGIRLFCNGFFALIDLFKISFVLYADFNLIPEMLWQSGWPQRHHACTHAPDVTVYVQTIESCERRH